MNTVRIILLHTQRRSEEVCLVSDLLAVCLPACLPACLPTCLPVFLCRGGGSDAMLTRTRPPLGTGTFSKKILEVLDSEIQTPGAFAYARIASQNPFTGLPAFDLLQALGPMHLRKRARLQRTVWLYSDSNDVRGNLAVNLMNLDSEARTTAESRARDHAFDVRTLCLQIDIILSIVTRDLRVLPFAVSTACCSLLSPSTWHGAGLMCGWMCCA